MGGVKLSDALERPGLILMNRTMGFKLLRVHANSRDLAAAFAFT